MIDLLKFTIGDNVEELFTASIPILHGLKPRKCDLEFNIDWIYTDYLEGEFQ